MLEKLHHNSARMVPARRVRKVSTLSYVHASARIRLPDGSRVEMLPGDLIGRTATAALWLDDPRISEAHAMLSLRGGELRLLALRRMVALDGKPVSELVLRKDQRVELARDLELVVEEVSLPRAVPALQIEGLGERLLGSVASLRITKGEVSVSARYEPGADAHVWSTDEQWRLRIRDGVTRNLAVGDSFDVDGCAVLLTEVALHNASQTPTRVDGGVRAPLHIVAQFDSVALHLNGRPPVVFGGRGARILSELVRFEAPVPWEMLAREVWPQEPEPGVLRHRLDVNLGRLRSRLRSAGIRTDLVRPDGAGSLGLVLYDGDSVEDKS